MNCSMSTTFWNVLTSFWNTITSHPTHDQPLLHRQYRQSFMPCTQSRMANECNPCCHKKNLKQTVMKKKVMTVLVASVVVFGCSEKVKQTANVEAPEKKLFLDVH